VPHYNRRSTFVCTLVLKGSMVRCEIPSSRSFCKLIGVPFIRRDNPITSKDAEAILSSSVFKDSICLAAPPQIVCNSRCADTCTVYFDIWDSQTGSRMKSFVDCSLNVGTMVCYFRKESMKIGMPYCTRCCSWGHNTNYCNSRRVFGPICQGPHCEINHCALAACCKGHPKQVPPVPPTTNDAPCPHIAICKNCGKPHAANSSHCQFWQHRFDCSWIIERYARPEGFRAHVHPLTGETGTRCKDMAKGRGRNAGEAITDE